MGEVSATYGITNLIIVSLIYLGIVFAGAWLANKNTRLFGLLVAVSLFVFAYVHALTLYFMHFQALPQSLNVVAPLLAMFTALVAVVIEFGRLRTTGSKIIYKGYWRNFSISFVISALVTIAYNIIP